jgi:DMSO/TMAO reductase YedYZ molybdopterin-dependent catalytic subunit
MVIFPMQYLRFLCAFLFLAGLMGCQPQVANEQLEQWHQEAIAENARLTETYRSNLSNNWVIRVQGQVQNPITLTWKEIESLADTTMISVKPYSGSPKTPFKFRGILAEKLLKKAVVESSVEEVTIVASDSFYTTITLKDLYFHQGLLAISENDQPIRRNEGGPVHMLYYYNPQDLSRGTNERGWSYYATHVIVGTEPLQLKVENSVLERVDLEKLPIHKTTVLVGFQLGWKSEPVPLVGIKIRDILRSQNVIMPPKSILKVRRKSMDDLDPQKSVKIPANLIDECDVMLAYQWGEDSQNIPASKGGPLTLAYGNNCPSEALKNLAWLPFVESISVETVEPKL